MQISLLACLSKSYVLDAQLTSTRASLRMLPLFRYLKVLRLSLRVSSMTFNVCNPGSEHMHELRTVQLNIAQETGFPPPSRPPPLQDDPLDFPPMGACAGCEREETADMPTMKCSACNLTRSVDWGGYERLLKWYVLPSIGTALRPARKSVGQNTSSSTRSPSRSNGCGHRSRPWALSSQ